MPTRFVTPQLLWKGKILFSRAEKDLLLETARAAVTSAVLKTKKEFSPQRSPALDIRVGVFVTLRKAGKLRGCIGFTESEDLLLETLDRAARATALKDHRFEPVRADELPKLTYELSILTPQDPISSFREFKAGFHGVVMELGTKRALFLPHVAEEQGWDEETTLCQLSKKAGLGKYAFRDPQARFWVFGAEKVLEQGAGE